MKIKKKSLKNMMVCWNDNGSVALVPWPDEKRIGGRYDMSDGACYSNVRRMNLDRRKHVLFEIVSKLIVVHSIFPAKVHDALKELEEYPEQYRSL